MFMGAILLRDGLLAAIAVVYLVRRSAPSAIAHRPDHLGEGGIDLQGEGARGEVVAVAGGV
jgi:hypothetical protein